MRQMQPGLDGSKPSSPEGLVLLGDTLKSVGKYDDSIVAYRDATALNPNLAEAHCNMGQVLYELGRFEDAVLAHKKALQARPDYAKAHAYLGRTFSALGRYGEAVRSFEQAADARSGYAKAYLFLGLTHMQQGDIDAAIAAQRRAIEIDPGHEKAHYNLAIAHLAAGKGEMAMNVCDSFLAKKPGNTRILGFKAMILQEMGENLAAAAIMDYDRFVKTVTLETPDGYESLDAFNQALVDHVSNHPSLVREPTSRTTKNGSHTGEILADPEGPLVPLVNFMKTEVRAYMADLAAAPDSAAHPYIKRMPEKWSLGGWSVIMENQGQELTHIHPEGWMSGCYYVQIPDAVSDDGDGQDGWLELGRPRDNYPCKADFDIRAFRPEPGLMRLFPSFFYHRTIPFKGTKRRICVAFDMKPC